MNFFLFLLILQVVIINFIIVHGGNKRKRNSDESVGSSKSIGEKNDEQQIGSIDTLIKNLKITEQKPRVQRKNKKFSSQQFPEKNASNSDRKANYDKNLIKFKMNLASIGVDKMKIGENEERYTKKRRLSA